ncbi:MAG: SH3 domain-containing protein [Granulosicoccus sp.]|nr:SH3 domain-containing protein [Granulosicoccus sp.]
MYYRILQHNISKLAPKAKATRSVMLMIALLGAGLASEAYANCVRDVNSYTNVRSDASTKSAAVGKFYISQPFPYIHRTVTGQSINGNSNWYVVTHNRNTNRYVHSSKVARTTTSGHSSRNAQISLNNHSSYLNVRSGPGTCHSIRSSLKHGTSVIVTGSTPEHFDSAPQNIWVEIKDSNNNQYLGFVSNKFLRY